MKQLMAGGGVALIGITLMPLLCEVAHLGVDVIKQAGEIGHDRRCQQ